MTSDRPTGTVTFLFTDIEGSTELAQQYPDALPALLARHHALVQQAIDANHGYVFQIIGDAFCVSFHTAPDAINAALGAQRLLQHEAWNPAPIKVRMGINTGVAQAGSGEDKSGGYTGYSTLARTQRVLSTAIGGQVLLSNASADLVLGGLPESVSLRDMGEHQLKGLLNAEHLWQLVAPDLISDFPPLKTAVLIPNNLPTQLSSFIGREKEIAEVSRLLLGTDGTPSPHRLVTLTGVGGTGKTRLSLQIAAEVLDKYKDGVWFVELASITDPNLFPQGVAATLKVKESTGTPIIQTLSDYFRDRHLLLILDNFEQIVSAAPIIRTFLNAAPKINVLVSSREVLRVRGEQVYHVLPLSLPDAKRSQNVAELAQVEAIAMFVQLAQAANPAFILDEDNANIVAGICAKLDGLPLAIELAAARSRLLKPAVMLEKLSRSLETLVGGARDLPQRQQTIRDAIDWSYELLDAAEKILFARLSVFVGGWTIDSASSICGVGLTIDVLSGLESLLNKSLLRQVEGSLGETRLSLLETIREYARERLAVSGEAETFRQRHAEFFTAWVDRIAFELRAGPTQMERFAQLELEQGNLGAALEWSFGSGDSELALRLVGAIFYYWWREGYWLEWKHWLSLTERHLARVSELTRAGALEMMSAMAYFGNNNRELARRYSSEALEIFRRLGSRRDIGWAIYWFNNSSYGVAEEYNRAVALGNEAIALFQAENDLPAVAQGYNNLGTLASLINETEAAKIADQQSLEIARAIGDQLREHILYSNFGEYALAAGDDETAFAFYKKSLEWAIAQPNFPLILSGFAQLIKVWITRGQHQRVVRLIGAGEMLSEKSGAKLQPGEKAIYDSNVTWMHEQLGDEAFQTLRTEGRAQTLEQAIELALGETHD